MMEGQVRVYNDNIHPYTEHFKGEDLEIAPKCYIEKDFYDAVELLGTYSPIKTDGGGQQIATSFKKLRIVRPAEFKLEESKKILCNSCGEKFNTADLLEDHVLASHLDQMIDETEKKKRLKKREQMHGKT